LTPTYPFAGDVENNNPDELLQIDEMVTPPPETSTNPVPVSTPKAKKKILWRCDVCGEMFTNEDFFKVHASKKHTQRMPVIKQVDEPTYKQWVVGKIERFDERNTVFNRNWWDGPYQEKVKIARSKAPIDDWDRFEGRALAAGAIFVDDKAGSVHPAYYGYNGHVRGGGGLFDWDEPANSVQYPINDPAEMSKRIKEVAKFYGADLVGITEVDPNWVYSNYFEGATGANGELNISYKYAIVIGIEMQWDEIRESPGIPASAATALGYSKMPILAGSLAKYVRTLGYEAIPCGNDTTQSIPLAIDAGLGELGRNGLLITPEFGPRQRICKVLTSMPLAVDKPIDFGMQTYCETCHACGFACPAKAIMMGDRTTEITSISNRKGLLRWPVNVSNCLLFWRENGVDCANCVAACPWAIKSTRDWLEL
jgi:ferredoxin